MDSQEEKDAVQVWVLEIEETVDGENGSAVCFVVLTFALIRL